MSADASHNPSCDLLPAWERRRARVCVPLLAAALLLPASAMAQEVRARDLSIIEDLLAETVQEAIQGSVRAVNTENLQSRETEQEAGNPMTIRYVFRSGGRTQARGMFLEDYGVVFTVQVPNLAYAPSAMFVIPESGGVTMIEPGSFETVFAGALGQEMQLRNQMSRMRAEQEVLIRRLENQVAASGDTSENARRLRTAIAEMERAYNEYAAAQEQNTSEREQSQAEDESRGGGNRASATDRYSGLRVLASASAEDIRRAETLVTEQKNQIEGAVIAAVVDTLAQYGRVIHGLEDEDRLAVVLLPSSYLNQVTSWSRATQRDEEFIISVRYRDIVELDKGNIDPEEFGGRIRVESRLGQPHQQR